jgi:GNAT superfamily N-acetyltransferase
MTGIATESAIHIRQARPQDVDNLLPLLQLLFSIEEDFRYDGAKQRQGLELLLDHPQAMIAVAETAGRIIGMATGQLVISTAEGGPSLLVEDVVVAEVFRGHGVGRKLLIALGDWATGPGATRLQLLADKENSEALDFYTRLGWQVTRMICLRKFQ